MKNRRLGWLVGALVLALAPAARAQVVCMKPDGEVRIRPESCDPKAEARVELQAAIDRLRAFETALPYVSFPDEGLGVRMTDVEVEIVSGPEVSEAEVGERGHLIVINHVERVGGSELPIRPSADYDWLIRGTLLPMGPLPDYDWRDGQYLD